MHDRYVARYITSGWRLGPRITGAFAEACNRDKEVNIVEVSIAEQALIGSWTLG